MLAWEWSAMSLLDTIARALTFRTVRPAEPAKNGRDSAEMRRLRRVRQRMRSGAVWSDKLIAPRPCMFKDLSVGGAQVEILGAPIKPGLLMDGLWLYFDTEKHEVSCSLVWMNGRTLGLRFEGALRPPSRKYG